jgi:hypothetical protein
LFVPTEKDSLKGDNKKSASVLSSVAAQDLNKRIDPRSQNHASEKKMPPNQNNGPFPRDDKIMVENASKPQLTLIAENGSKSASRNSNPALSDSEDNKEELPLPSKEPIRLKAAPAEKNPNQLNLFPKTGPPTPVVSGPQSPAKSGPPTPNINKGFTFQHMLTMKILLPHGEALRDGKYALNFANIQTNQATVTEESMYVLGQATTPFRGLQGTNFYFDKRNLVKKLDSRLNEKESKEILHGKFIPLDDIHFECEHSVEALYLVSDVQREICWLQAEHHYPEGLRHRDPEHPEAEVDLRRPAFLLELLQIQPEEPSEQQTSLHSQTDSWEAHLHHNGHPLLAPSRLHQTRP